MKIALIENNTISAFRPIDRAFYDKLVADNNPKIIGWLPVTESRQPEITATQRLVPQYEIAKSEVIETWLVEDDPEKVAAAAKITEINSAISDVEAVFKAWESADEKSRGEILHKMFYVIVEALKSLGAPVSAIEKPKTP